MCSLKKFKGNLMIIMCEMWIHIPLQTQLATSTKAKTLIVLDHKGSWCTMTTTRGKVPARFRASCHIGFSKNRMIRNNAN
jgi:hypothetical protein